MGPNAHVMVDSYVPGGVRLLSGLMIVLNTGVAGG